MTRSLNRGAPVESAVGRLTKFYDEEALPTTASQMLAVPTEEVQCE
jgi:hypothetical protein